ncbi:hypothetical protein KL86DES1_21036 [uncultured Desulfovibrio sp.]|uniref:Uncharacterized protein n=1 Tax=uncultured Desulfovibrio sp. TaxID=167968 RepID=A0A212L6G5_9BACT|nr:hypothetical protein KL86DES1_21036 [uncultured Desulfovibrio sp.]
MIAMLAFCPLRPGSRAKRAVRPVPYPLEKGFMLYCGTGALYAAPCLEQFHQRCCPAP